MQNNRTVGTEFEHLAGKYLEEKGYQILCYNYRCPLGEIDVIAMEKTGQEDTLVFVEVKYRKNLAKGSPLEAVNQKKQRVISKCANYYIMGIHANELSCRFDVIGIVGSAGNEITHIENAFEYQG